MVVLLEAIKLILYYDVDLGGHAVRRGQCHIWCLAGVQDFFGTHHHL